MSEQGSIEWLQDRLGYVTASRVADVMAVGRNGEATTRANYKWELITQRLTNRVVESYQNEAMAWGTQTEPQARVVYEIKSNVFVDQTGFEKHPTIKWVGASPDGLIDTDGGLEIKCPNSSTHLQTLKTQKVPTKYIPQMQMGMWVTGRKWWDFVSFDPRLPDDLQYFCKRVDRDDEYIAEMEAKVLEFLAEVEQEIILLKRNQNA